MIKNKLLKGLMLGIAISSLYTVTAYAQMVDDNTISSGGQTEVEINVLFEKQREIDQVLFFDQVADIEKQGFRVNYTGVAEDYIEIGITPYSDENAKFLYELLGNQDIKVVASDDSVLYTTQEAKELAATSGLADVPVTKEAEELAATSGLAQEPVTGEVDPDTPVSSTDADAALEEELTIQIESVDDQNAELDVEEGVPAQETMEIQIESTAEDGAIAESGAINDTKDQKDGLSTPIIVLMIAGGAVILGGGILAVTKKGFK